MNKEDKTQEVSEFATLTKQIEDLRVAYALQQNGWVEAAFVNDPALAKYDSAHNLRAAIEAASENVELTRYPGLTVMAAHEVAHELYNQATNNTDKNAALGQFAQARALSETAASMSGADIHPGAQINSNLFIDHNTGVVIGETAIVGKNCFLLHGVTLGGSGKEINDERIIGGKRRHPALGDWVEIGSNANVYGACDIGDNVKINTGATLINCEIGADSKISAGCRLTGSKIGGNVKIYPDAQVFDCEIGEGAVIGAGVRLDKVKIPAYARICDVQPPKLVIYDANHEGVVTARGKEVSSREAYAGNAEKTITAAVFAEAEDFQKSENWTDKLAAFVAEKAKQMGAALH